MQEIFRLFYSNYQLTGYKPLTTSPKVFPYTLGCRDSAMGELPLDKLHLPGAAGIHHPLAEDGPGQGRVDQAHQDFPADQ